MEKPWEEMTAKEQIEDLDRFSRITTRIHDLIFKDFGEEHIIKRTIDTYVKDYCFTCGEDLYLKTLSEPERKACGASTPIESNLR